MPCCRHTLPIYAIFATDLRRRASRFRHYFSIRHFDFRHLDGCHDAIIAAMPLLLLCHAAATFSPAPPFAISHAAAIISLLIR